MIDPLCRDCKTRHKLGAEFCPLYKDESKTSAQKILKEVMPHSDSSIGLRAGQEHDIGPQANKAKPHPQIVVATEGGAKFDRNAYQREYMRKWRAKRNGN